MIPMMQLVVVVVVGGSVVVVVGGSVVVVVGAVVVVAGSVVVVDEGAVVELFGGADVVVVEGADVAVVDVGPTPPALAEGRLALPGEWTTSTITATTATSTAAAPIRILIRQPASGGGSKTNSSCSGRWDRDCPGEEPSRPGSYPLSYGSMVFPIPSVEDSGPIRASPMSLSSKSTSNCRAPAPRPRSGCL